MSLEYRNLLLLLTRLSTSNASKRSIKKIALLTFALSFFTLFSTTVAAESCNSLTNNQKAMVKNNFKHDPFSMISTVVEIATGNFEESQKNLSIELVFDLTMMYRQTSALHRSKTFKNPYMSFIKSNFFGLFRKLYTEPSKLLQKKRFDFLNAEEHQNIKKGSISFTSFNRSLCQENESLYLGCKGHYYKISTLISPELSCNINSTTNKGFQVDFYLTYSNSYGFKIADVDLSGKRVALDLFEYMYNLKSRGYNNSALLSQLQLLQPNNTPFEFPKRLRHSKNIIAITQTTKERLPTSL